MGKNQWLYLGIYILSILWCFLFAAISISTGELKPRGLFVDENALSVKFSSSDFHAPHIQHNSSCRTWDSSCICDMFSAAPFDCIGASPEMEVVRIDISPRSGIITRETTVFAFLVDSVMPELWLLDFVKLFCTVVGGSEWTTKSVVVLLVPVTGKDSFMSPSLERWVQFQHGQSSSTRGELRNNLIRSSYIISLGSGSGDINLSPRTMWPGDIRVKTAGVNGQLPNMDLISNLRAIQSRTIVFNAQIPQWFRSSNVHLRAYMDRLYDLISFSTSLMWGPSGLHHIFLSKNIDSLTVSLGDPVVAYKASGRGARNHAHDMSIGDLLEFLMRMVRSDQLLHEELHHSFFFYLLMGPNHFVGISEYCSCLLFSMLPLFFMIVRRGDVLFRRVDPSIDHVLPNLMFSDIILPVVTLYISFHVASAIQSRNLDNYLSRSFKEELDCGILASVWLTFSGLQLLQRINCTLRSRGQRTVERESNSITARMFFVLSLAFYVGVQNVALALPIALIATPLCIYLDCCWPNKLAIVAGSLLSPFCFGLCFLAFGMTGTLHSLLSEHFQLRSILPSVIILSQILSNAFLSVSDGS